MKKTLIVLILTVLLIGCSSQPKYSAQVDDNWQSLFNGTDLSGWHIRCMPKDRDKVFWTVNDGVIEANSMGRGDHDYVWLISDGEYDNFHLRLKFQAFRSSNGNSGVQFRSRYDSSAPNGGWLNGPQVDIHPPIPFHTGLIYDETKGYQRWIWPSLKNWEIQPDQAPPAAHQIELVYADNDAEAWNSLEIICDEMHVQTLVNGLLVSDYDAAGVLDDAIHKARNVGTKGHIALQLHANDELRIRFKDIQIKMIK